jgi:aspartate aminotransferase
VDPGDAAIYPVPTWNNNHYAYLSGSRGIPIPVSAATNFFPTPDQIRPHVPGARLLILNSPLNPTGTAISKQALTDLTTMIVEENLRRDSEGRRRPLYLVYDQVYWTLTFGRTEHHTPVGLVPESAPYVVFLDAISKAFCATGMRVGWGVMPPPIRQRMSDILGHVGAWAPKAEQAGVAQFLSQPEAVYAFRATVRRKLEERLQALYDGVMAMKRDGFPVDAVEPQGAIYLSVRFDLFGRTVRGVPVRTNDDVRRLLLEEAGLGVVPFQAFGFEGDTGWFRLSVGAVSMEDIAAAFPRLRAMLAGAPAAV